MNNLTVTITDAVELSPGLTHVGYWTEGPRYHSATTTVMRSADEPSITLGVVNLSTSYRGSALVGTTGASLLPMSQLPGDVSEPDMRAAIFAAEMRRREQAK